MLFDASAGVMTLALVLTMSRSGISALAVSLVLQLEELDVEGILAFAERVLPRAADLRVDAAT